MPKTILYLFFLIIFSSCSSVKYYIVRHAEKETASAGTVMNTPDDPPLSAAGRVRAIGLREALKNKGIQYIFSTNTLRTISTAQPLEELQGGTRIETYNTRDSLDHFIDRIRLIQKGNVLIVGHSNTVDDIVNKLVGETKVPNDLPDSEYDNLYIVTKKGNRYRFENKTYGNPTN
ncbi:MAG TPA: histidine phosphatase family protein [Chitinophagaceae bacterium]|nr:histidine phosphatase family protein [Chitinophagaceae bacterium]